MLMDMGFRDLFRPKPTPPAERADPAPRAMSGAEHERLMAWAHAMETGALAVPDDVHDREAWDRYWRTQIEVGAIEQGFNDMMASDPQLVSLLIERGATSILCAGNGLSSEAYALALHGFAVTALDIAPIVAAAHRGAYIDGPQAMPGLTLREDGAIAFPAGPIDSEVCPRIHRAEGVSPRGGGSLRYAIGDLMDADVCPGPFDVVIERRTVQLFPAAERAAALARLTGRLGPRAFFISHQHKGAWRPHEPRTHYAEEWLDSSDFVREGLAPRDAPRVARLWLTTG